LEADLIHELAFRRANDGGGDDGEFEPQTELDYAAILLRHSAAKQRELIALTAQLERIESDIENVERANVELRASNRSLVERFLPHAFVSRAQQSRPANAHELLAQANRSVDTCIVLRNVLKQLVFESGVNWALDATLRRVILEPDEKLLL
jgi:hypothetical protein